ncbi:E3 SUMO-protein ligase RanBP2 [Frankliniella fusca]|uniref:E3 SUMO-protein ligase RanBP2 n=1 Tax=Frankliniella fusca TaxID=407009 RepID=A0AAE1LU88_9NEOP|nr:E3 SUMO-protein ligase RanBP2 [Frankliniella fusca]
MLRSKKDVDKHVQEVFRNINTEKERNLRCYNVAKLYHKVGDFQSTQKYVELYLKDRPNVAGAHKLLGQAFEGLKDTTKALEEYKCSLSLESRQPDLVLKVCDLLVESKTRLNSGEVKYWIERAEEISDNHETVFRLKECLLKMGDGSGDQAQLAQLIEKEIEARPQDPIPRTRLLNFYLDSKRVSDAYKYATDLETRCLFRDNIQWYSCIVEVLKAYQQDVKNIDGEFYIYFLCVLERHASLCSQEQLAGHYAPFSSAIHALDQACHEASKYCKKGGEQRLLECLKHVSSQLCFHLGTALLRIAKQSRTREWTPYVWALMTLAYTSPETVDFTSNSSQSGREKQRKLMKFWKEDCAFRCSQAGHMLLNMPHEKKRFCELNGGRWREKIYKLMFPVHIQGKPDLVKSSHFMNDDSFGDFQDLSLSEREISQHDIMAQHQRPDSLHFMVWLGLKYLGPANKQTQNFGTNVIPYRLSTNFACFVFEELKFSTSLLETGGVETLSRLDVETFLYASVFCAAASDRQFTSVLGEGRPLVLPVDLTEPLCTESQAKWWSSAYRLHSNKSRSDIGEIRMIVSRGLEVVRLIGNHGMDVRLMVLLAKFFSEKASDVSTPKDNLPDIYRRAQMFWHSALTLLERIEKNQPIRMPPSPLFSFGGRDLTMSEVRQLLEEGRFFMACRLMKEEKYDKAIESLKDLKSPHASYYEGLIYKKLADAERESLNGDKINADSKFIILLQKSRSAFYLTLDRLRSPQNAGSSPLDGELEKHLEEVESLLSPLQFDNNGTSHDGGLCYDSFTSFRMDDAYQTNSRFGTLHNTLLTNVGLHGQPNVTSTPCKVARNNGSDTTHDFSQREEARPSPERQDAQMRRMTVTLDKVLEQNRLMTLTIDKVMETLDKTKGVVEDLQKQMGNLRLEVSTLKQNDNRNQMGSTGFPSVPSAEEYDYYRAAPDRSYRAFQEAYSYDNRQAATPSVPMSSMLPKPFQSMFPENQVPIARNIDPSLFSVYYPQATVGQNLYERQGAGAVAIANTLPGVLPGTSMHPNSLAASIPSNVPSAVHVPVDGAITMDSYRRSLLGTPILSHSSLTTSAVDLSPAVPSVNQSHHLPIVDSTSQRFSQPGSFSAQTLNKPVAPSQAVEPVPHNFQISMPPQATIPTTESLEKSLSPLKPISTEGILPNVPMPTYSAVSSRQTEVKPSRASTGSTSGNDTFTEDADYNPCADFKPIIPLPEEITVTTGEEDETPLFSRRAKLFRFVGGEWKERGIGDIKILKHNINGKLRILMRREQVYKICANHFILPEMELAPQTGSDRAWSWGANDFSDGEARIEKLCVRFKTVEDAQQFKEAFDNARKLAKSATPVKSNTTGVSTVSAAPPLGNQSSLQSSPATGKVELGGFSFLSPPVLKPVEQAKAAPGKEKETTNTPTKPSPFAGFSFTPSSGNSFGNLTQTVSSGVGQSAEIFPPSSATPALSTQSLFVSKTPVSSSISSTSAPLFSNSSSLLDFASIASQNKNSEVVKKDTNFKGFPGTGTKVFGGTVSSTTDFGNKSGTEPESGDAEEFEPTAEFKPVIPLPSLIEVRTGEEDEDVLFEERAKLLRFDSVGTQWKERGIGKIKVLKNKTTGKVRLLMRREQVHKVCCNHFLTQDLLFKPLSTSDKAITWSAQDYSEGEVRVEVFALRFKTPELMVTFKDIVEKLQKEVSNTPQGNPTAGTASTNAKPLSEVFKPKQGSWECSGCFTRNDAEQTKCPCCSQPKPVIDVNTSSSVSSNTPTTTKDKQPALSELFKPKEGSWVCKDCYTRCDADNFACLACEAPKPGHENDRKPAKTSFSFGNTEAASKFSFGISSSAAPTETKAFSFGSAVQGETKPTFTFGVPPSAPVTSSSLQTAKGFSFGSTATAASTTSSGFVFGASTLTPNRPSQPSQPSFGSPHKFEFQMKAQSPAKSPGAPSGEEESEEEDNDNADVGDFKPVIPLPDKVPVLTGEEDETVLYCHRAKLFRFVEGEWKERGIGDIKVLSHNVTNKPRLLMRREQVLKICLNHYILPDLDMKKKDEKTWIWGAKDFSDGQLAVERFACRFKTPEIGEEFKTAVDQAKALTILPSPAKEEASSNSAADDDWSQAEHNLQSMPYRFSNKEYYSHISKIPLCWRENSCKPISNYSSSNQSASMKNFSFKLPSNDKPVVVRSLFGTNDSSSDEVEVVYEAKVSPEEKSAALKLQLPENFYLYKQVPPCSGCPGCEKDSDSDQGDNQSSASVTPASSVASSTASTFNASALVGGSGTSLFSSTSFSQPSSTGIFGGGSTFTQPSAAPLFGSLFGTSGTLGSTAVNSPSTAFPMFGAKFSTPSKEDTPFLPVSNSPSFASLAAANSDPAAFKPKDTSKTFSFAGAGSKVFGASSSGTPPKKDANDEDGESGGEPDTSEAAEVETHDPHFEPIIALPEMVEVRTGEEDEEKLFCQRAKLFRYDSKTKEWKERGVGEIKILKHPVNGTFRLLLRREQVHKVVLNQRLDENIKLNPLKTSDKAWCWGGLNHAEDPAGALEELAIRFKNSELADEFRSKVEECQKLLAETCKSVLIADGPLKDDTVQDVDDEADEGENCEDEDYEDDGEILFEENVTLKAEDCKTQSTVEGKGCIRVILANNLYYVEMEDESGMVLCKAPIQGDSEVQREGNICIWRSVDLADDEQGVDKKFVSTFTSEEGADAFQELYSKITLEIVESTYDYVDEH